MTSLFSSRDLLTPIEPGFVPQRASRAAAATSAEHALHANACRRIEAAAVSSCGGQHAVNEDAHSALGRSARLFVVADGVGGGAMAQTASRLLVAELHDVLATQPIDRERVAAAVLAADHAIATAIARVTDRPGAATVVLAAPLDLFASKWLVAWVGDCRAYRWVPQGGGAIELLTRDDTFAHLGEAPPAGGAPGDPARMVGNGATTGANAIVVGLAKGELLALCSDGVHKHLDGDDWRRVLAAPVALARRAEAVVARARIHGSVDDATVLLLERGDARWRGLPWRAAPRTGTGTERSAS